MVNLATVQHIHQSDVVPRPAVLRKWEYSRHHRFHWLVESFAEAMGVFLYVWFGVGSTASFIITNVGQQPGLGSLFQVGFAYAIGVVMALVCCSATSGGHFNPCITIVFAMFRGFPWSKVPRYIVSQIIGAYIACLMIYLQYKDTIHLLEEGLAAAGKSALMFTPNGPAGIFGLYPNPGKPLGIIFFNEFVIDFVLAFVIWSCLDPTNFFAPPAAAPWIIGFAYGAAIWGFAPANMAANSARDVGSRLMVLTIWGKQASGGAYAAIAALTNIPATILAVVVYEFFMVDSSRVLPPAQRDFLSGHKAHIDRKTDANPANYYSSNDKYIQENGSSTDDGKARVEMRE